MEDENTSMLEDGELDDFDDHYTPLERPTTTPQQKPTVIEDPEFEDDIKSSTSSSDSDDYRQRPKKSKLKVNNQPRPPRKDKYKVWNSSVQEEVLIENLVNADVSYVDRSRKSETYPVFNNKRSYGDRNNRTRLPTKRNDFETKGETPRYILDLKFGVDASAEEIASDMAIKLLEEKEDLIKIIVEIAGKEKAIEIFKQTQQIEKDGGLLILNHQRRRTPGGVFFYLLKHDTTLTRDQQNAIFNEDKLQFKRILKAQKRQKMQNVKQKFRASGQKALPELLTLQELQLLKTENENVDMDVKNPPPSPVTDGVSNSPDDAGNFSNPENARTVVGYNDDYIDITIDTALD